MSLIMLLLEVNSFLELFMETIYWILFLALHINVHYYMYSCLVLGCV